MSMIDYARWLSRVSGMTVTLLGTKPEPEFSFSGIWAYHNRRERKCIGKDVARLYAEGVRDGYSRALWEMDIDEEEERG